ncbi:Uma2 family endonuclease [Trichothermofontia sichuanensis B231]|uniref:Uma2 family endonuclease n=1 Tax=Trichothermofontia sichuanensis TaxID=3045816 RepID=UPI002246E2CC|nr:Uma2 family endonuclease [Trichothermofontia sichuanensis]UZQ53860.1 Uma2 family endonuclease [Trichothermofontia sichuanensis B231]
MIAPELLSGLPSTEELPCSDDTPVDNEDQNSLPNLLLFMLASLWAERMDWYFGVDMAIYHTTGEDPRIPVVPDAFLSLGVERRKGGRSRRSYATWEENGVVPTLVLEMVSHKPGGEYGAKQEIYRQLGVLYYVIYNPEFWQRDRHQPFEVYRLVDGQYQQVFSTAEADHPYWFPEVGLGLGFRQQRLGGIEQEILVWYDAQGNPYPTPDEVQLQLRQRQQELDAERQRAESERQRAESERQRAEQLAQYLRSLGIDPDHLPDC